MLLSYTAVEFMQRFRFSSELGALTSAMGNRYKFSFGAQQFVNDWNAYDPTHHCAVGVGHIAVKIEKLGSLLGMEVAKVC